MKNIILKSVLITVFGIALLAINSNCSAQTPKFKALVLTERGGIHEGFVAVALEWLNKLATEENFAITVINKTDTIDEAFLSNYQVFIQLNYPPYAWTEKSMNAFEKFINQGKIGWGGLSSRQPVG